MKYIKSILILMIFPFTSFSNGVGKNIDKYPLKKEEKKRSHEKLLKKEQIIRQQMEENPRNEAIIRSFEDVSSHGKINKKSKDQKASQ